MTEYQDFLASKRIVAPTAGVRIDDPDINPMLFPFQRDMVRWSLRKGRAAIFSDTGTGKTMMQLEWARLRGQRTLILAPLAVARQTVAEGLKLGIDVTYARSQEQASDGITITNYEMLPHFDPAAFGSVVLDESSILKSFEGKTRTMLIEAFSETPYRLCCTATPAPNDIAEIANHAEFLGIMSRTGMLATFFVHDDEGWRLKRHGREPFYRWMASWGMSLKRPSDLGYSDDGYVLPPLSVEPQIVQTDWTPEGQLFATELRGITHRAGVRKATLAERVQRAADLIAAEPGQPWIAWCGLNEEARLLASIVPGAVNVEGSNTLEYKEAAARWFQGSYCICSDDSFRAKLTAWRRVKAITSEGITKSIERNGSLLHVSTSVPMPKIVASTTPNTMSRTKSKSPNRSGAIVIEPALNASLSGRPNMPPTPSLSNAAPQNGKQLIPSNGLISECENMDSLGLTIPASSPNRVEDAPSVVVPMAVIGDGLVGDSTLITPMGWEQSEDSCAQTAISESASSSTILSSSNEQPCICGHTNGRRILVSKSPIYGLGLNFQACARMVFVGINDSYESYYQAIRRCWRYGQMRPVKAYVVLSDVEMPIYHNVLRKEEEAARMSEDLIKHVAQFEREEILKAELGTFEYREDEALGEKWRLLLGDSVERINEIPDESIDLSVFSPPFQSLYTYSATERDLGNSATRPQFWQHFGYIIDGLLRVMKPGRNVAVHCMDLPTTLLTQGVIGLEDFRGQTIAAFSEHGFTWHGVVTIDKDPQAQAIRTHAKGLLFVQLRKDASWLRPGLADYILIFRKPGENAVPVTPDITNDDWIEWARPIWYGIRESDTLNAAEGRGNDDERHIAPLQLGTIERCVRLWSNPGETVFSPFAGIGSEGYQALLSNRSFIGIELNGGYFRVAARNLARAEDQTRIPTLFDWGGVTADAEA